jgi:hypothetical protein
MTARRNLPWEGGDEHAQAGGEEIVIANEFAEVRVCRVETRNGSRLLIESPRSGRWIALCPLEVEALTWQNTETFSAMIGQPFAPLTGGDADQ